MLPIALVGSAAAIAWLAVALAIRPRSLTTVGIVLLVAAQTEPGLRFVEPIFGMALLFLVAGAVVDPRSARISHSLAPPVALPLAVMLVCFALSHFGSSSLLSAAPALVGAAAVVVAALVSARGRTASQLLDQLALACGAFIGVSVVVSPVVTFDIEGTRFRGVLENANTLGVIAVLLAASAPRHWLRVALPLSSAVIFFTSSRASAVAIVVIVVARVSWRPSNRITAVFAAALVLAGLLLAGALTSRASVGDEQIADPTRAEANESADDRTSLFRTRNTREATWSQAIDDAGRAFPSGTGYGTASVEYGSSPLLALVELGVVAIPVFACAAVLFRRAWPHPDQRVRALLAGLLLHSVFEGWMFAFGSFIAIVFWLVIITAALERIPRLGEDPTAVATHGRRGPAQVLR